jgi:hypothetical protein
MKSINIKFPFTVNDLLGYFDQLSTDELKRVSEKITQLLSKRNNQSPEKRETQLLNIIRQKLPTAFLNRFEELKLSMERGQLSKSEIPEMEAYMEKMEEFDNEKIKALHELAQLKSISFQRFERFFSPQ